MSSSIFGDSSRKSRTERIMSFDCVTYRPTMRMSAPFSRASFPVSGIIPPATAIKNFLSWNMLRIIWMRSSPLDFPDSWSIPR